MSQEITWTPGVSEEVPPEKNIGELLKEALGEEDLQRLDGLRGKLNRELAFEDKQWFDQALQDVGVDLPNRILSMENMSVVGILAFTPQDLDQFIDDSYWMGNFVGG